MIASFTLKEYRLFVLEELQEAPGELKADIWHVLSFQKYCYDNILGYKIKLDYHKHLIKFMKNINLYKTLPHKPLDSDESFLIDKKLDFPGFSKICVPELARVIWTGMEPMYDDLRFNSLIFHYLRMHASILIIRDKKEQLSSSEYIYLTKTINTSVETWIAEWRELIIDFNTIIRNTYKLLPRSFLKIS